MVATLARFGAGNYAVNSQRSFDAWGQIRNGAPTGDPPNRHCASLGHQQDNESGLIYMRARYYDATNGRFLSQDSEFAGQNWYAYCFNNPVSYLDASGNLPFDITGPIFFFFLGVFASWLAGGLMEGEWGKPHAKDWVVGIVLGSIQAIKAINKAFASVDDKLIDDVVKIAEDPATVAAEKSEAGSAIDESLMEDGMLIELLGEINQIPVDVISRILRYRNRRLADYRTAILWLAFGELYNLSWWVFDQSSSWLLTTLFKCVAFDAVVLGIVLTVRRWRSYGEVGLKFQAPEIGETTDIAATKKKLDNRWRTPIGPSAMMFCIICGQIVHLGMWALEGRASSLRFAACTVRYIRRAYDRICLHRSSHIPSCSNPSRATPSLKFNLGIGTNKSDLRYSRQQNCHRLDH